MSVQFKDGIWYAVIYYRDEFNKKRYKWYPADGEKDAERLERRLRTQKDDGELTISKKSTLKQFLLKWLDLEAKGILRPATVTNKTNQINNLCRNLEFVSLEKLDAITIQSHFKKELSRGLKPTSVKSQYDVLRQALDKAVAWNLINKNPCDAVTAPQRNEPSNNAFSMEQSEIFVEYVKSLKDNFIVYVICLLGFYCGLRRGEILGLRWSDIDLKNRSAYIKNSLDRMEEADADRLLKQKEIEWYGCKTVNKKGLKGVPKVLALGPVKTNRSEGYISIPEIAAEVLELHRKNQMAVSSKTGLVCDQNFVIRHQDGRPYDPDYATHIIPKLIKRHNKDKPLDKQLPVIRTHDMRHTYATMLYELGLDDKAVSEAVRHARTSFTTDYYVHFKEKVKSRPAQILNAHFGSKNPDLQDGLGNGLGNDKKTRKKAQG